MQLGLKDEDGEEFNLETSNGECDRGNMGSVCRTKVRRGALARAAQIKESELYGILLYVSWCSRRLARWPTARDGDKAAESIKQEFTSLADTYTMAEIESCISRITDWDDSIISEQLLYMTEKAEEAERGKITNSPLYKAFSQAHPLIDPDEFCKEYEARRNNFSQTAVYLLRQHFKENKPEEIESESPWSQSWLQHLPYYQEQWLKEVKNLESKTLLSQTAWRESIS